MPRRWLGDSTKPPAPGVDASRKLSGETHTASPVVLMTCSRVMPLSRSCVGVTSTWSCCSRWPQMETFAHARNADQPRFDLPTGKDRHLDAGELLGVDLQPSAPRPVEETGCMISGGADTFVQRHGRGHPFRDELACPGRIFARARRPVGWMTAPGRISSGSRPATLTPSRGSASIGEVMKAAQLRQRKGPGPLLGLRLAPARIRAIASTAMRGTLMMPNAMIPAARASTRMRNYRRKRVIQPNTAGGLPGRFRWARSARPAR